MLWFRQFDSTAVFVSLLENTLKDILRGFFTVLLSLLLAFGTAIYVLNINRYYTREGNQLITDYDSLDLLV